MGARWAPISLAACVRLGCELAKTDEDSAQARGDVRRVVRVRRLLPRRDLNPKNGATRLAFHVDAPAMILDEALDDREAKPDSVGLPMARKGLKDAIANGGGNARAVVFDLDDKLAALGSIDDKDRKSTRLNSSHVKISYAVFCLKKKK